MILQEKQFLFVIGSPRSGTSWLQLMLGAHPMVCTTAELRIFNAYFAKWIRAWEEEASIIDQGRWVQGLPLIMKEEEFYAYLARFLEDVYTRVLATRPQATHVLDKHPGYTAYTELINRFLPGAKFIHVIRDGRDVVASMLAAKKQLGFGSGTVMEAAAEWVKHVQLARLASRYEGRYIEVRYEDLIAAGESEMERVFDFCNLAASRLQVKTIVEDHHIEKTRESRKSPVEGVQVPVGFYRKGKVGSWREDLTVEQRYLMNRVAGELLSDLGYAQPGWWADNWFEKYSTAVKYRVTRLFSRSDQQFAA